MARASGVLWTLSSFGGLFLHLGHTGTGPREAETGRYHSMPLPWGAVEDLLTKLHSLQAVTGRGGHSRHIKSSLTVLLGFTFRTGC